MPVAMKVEVSLHGPLFRGQPADVVKQAAVLAVREIVEKGDEHIQTMSRPRPGGVFLSVAEAAPGQASRGRFRLGMRSKSDQLRGAIWNNVSYGPWLEGVSPMNEARRFKGYALFRRTTQWMQGQAKRILERHVHTAVKGLGGN